MTQPLVFRISGEPEFRDWNTGEPIEDSATFEGIYYSVAGLPITTPEGVITGVSGWFKTWLEDPEGILGGERAFAATHDPRGNPPMKKVPCVHCPTLVTVPFDWPFTGNVCCMDCWCKQEGVPIC